MFIDFILGWIGICMVEVISFIMGFLSGFGCVFSVKKLFDNFVIENGLLMINDNWLVLMIILWYNWEMLLLLFCIGKWMFYVVFLNL